MKEEFLFCDTQPTTATAVDVKAIVDSFFEANGLAWQNFKHICTDPSDAWRQKKVHHICEEPRDVLPLLATPITFLSQRLYLRVWWKSWMGICY